MFVGVYLCLLVFMYVCRCLSKFVGVYLFLSVFIYNCWCLSMFVGVYLCLSVFIYICRCLSMFVGVYICVLVFFYVCWCLTIIVGVYLCLLEFIYVCLFVSSLFDLLLFALFACLMLFQTFVFRCQHYVTNLGEEKHVYYGKLFTLCILCIVFLSIHLKSTAKRLC